MLQLVPAVLPQLPIMVERMVPQAVSRADNGKGNGGERGAEIFGQHRRERWGTSQGQIFGTCTESKKHACGETIGKYG